jgi:uncharacterized surface protein with fasciclin (FAS1) repeats
LACGENSTESDLSQICNLIRAAGLEETLRGAEGNYTVFLPNDSAIASLGQEIIDFLGSNSDVLEDILLHHVTDSRLLAGDLVCGGELKMLNEEGRILN